jgi:hypothetical protein
MYELYFNNKTIVIYNRFKNNKLEREKNERNKKIIFNFLLE